jgi:hypothetical protein
VATPPVPRLKGFSRPADRRSAFAVARRLTESSGATVEEIRKVTPGDYGVQLRFDGSDRVVRVHVAPDGTEAERVWCRAARDRGPNAGWADLRWPHRMVLGDGGRDETVVEIGS